MPDVTDLLDYTAKVRPPPLDELTRVAVRRRRRAVAAVTSTVAAAGLAVVLAIDPITTRDASPAPVAPIPTSTSRSTPDLAPGMADPLRFPPLTPEQIRERPGSVSEPRGDGPPGVGARVWKACRVACTPETPYRSDEVQVALEVTRDGFRTGALYPLDIFSGVSHVVDDWFLVSAPGDVVMVNAREQTRIMTAGDPVDLTDVVGPLAYAGGLVSVDVEDRVLHHVVSPAGSVWDWYGAGDTWYWGLASLTDVDGRVTRQHLVWRNPDGSFGHRVAPLATTAPLVPPELLRSGSPGTIAVIDPGPPGVLLVSTDHGSTWQRRLVPDDVTAPESLPDDWTAWPPA